MSENINIVQITTNLFLETTTGVIYAISGDIVARLVPEKDELEYIDEAPEQLKAELGVYLKRLNEVE